VVLQLYRGAARDEFIVDCNIHDFTGYAVYGDTVHEVAIIGTGMERFDGQEHGVRLDAGASSYLAENIVNASEARSPLSAFTFRGDNRDIVAVGNRVNRLIEFTPTDNTTTERVVGGLVEANVIYDDRSSDSATVALGITAQHVVARNNVFIHAPVAVGVDL